jgi:hypothetical protein
VTERIWYGYVDYTDDGRPFYVGKGLDKRVRVVDRNEKHARVSNKHGRTRVVEFCSKDEQAVLDWEVLTCAASGTYESRRDGIGCNFTKCGEGTSGHIPTQETRDRMSKSRLGRRCSPETRAKLSIAFKGRKLSQEQVANLVASNTGLRRTPEQLARMSAAHTGKKQNPESRAKKAVALRGRRHSPERLANIAEGKRRGKKPVITESSRAGMSAATKGKPKSPEQRAKISASNRRTKLLRRLAVTGALHTAEVLEQEAVGGGMPVCGCGRK